MKANYSAFFCTLKKNLNQQNQKTHRFISFGGKEQKVFASSGQTFAFIDKFGKGYGFGSNAYQQITTKFGKNASLPLPLQFTDELYEIACGEDFIVAINLNNKILISGQNYTDLTFEDYHGARGLSAFGKSFAFCFDSNKVALFHNKSPTVYELGNDIQILQTVLTSSELGILCNNGAVYSCKFGKEPSYLTTATRIFASSNAILLYDGKMKLNISNDNHITEYFLPMSFEVVNAGIENGDIFILDHTGRLAYTTEKQKQFTLLFKSFNSIAAIPLHGSIATFSLIGENPIFVSGIPNNTVTVGTLIPIKSHTHVAFPNGEDIYLTSSKEMAYFENTRVSFERLVPNLASSGNAGDFYFTSINRPVKLDRSDDTMFSVNLLAGDKVLVGDKPAVVAGTAQGSLWVIPENSQKIYVACDMTLKDVLNKIKLVSRENHTITEVSIDGYQAFIDMTPSFVETFNYSVGDLLWIPQRGICELLGVFANSLALLDISSRCVFSQEPYALKVLRRSNPKLPHTREVMRVDGKRVTLDISCNGNRFFVPTDRVMSPLGIATVLGFCDTAYIQTDEMRMNGYEAVPMDILKLQLVRRISMPAKRKIETNDGNIVSVFLDTEYAIDGILPGDIILIGSTYARAVGVCEEGWYALFKDDKKAKLLPPSMAVTVIYRADINATRAWTQNLQVGSPKLEEGILIPGDIVKLKGFGIAEFMGFTDTSMIFVSHQSGEVLSLTFSTCLLPDLFEIQQRPTLQFSLPE